MEQSLVLKFFGAVHTIFAVKPKTETLLTLLLWNADRLARPTFRNLTESYESWAYRNGFDRQLAILEKRKLVECDPATTDRVYRLTATGRLHALGGRDAPTRWSRPWDGQWRLVVFDIPNPQNTQRVKLRRYLRARGFGCLQNSVWITPDPLDDERKILLDGKVNVQTLTLFEARTCTGESDAEIVNGSWNFDLINERYARHLKILQERPPVSLRTDLNRRALLRWAAAEREAWLHAITCDPLLPERILPAGYLGKDSWHRRLETFRVAGRQILSFKT